VQVQPVRMNRRNWWLLGASIVLLALVASVAGLHNQFAYDDVFIIERDDRVHTLVRWWHFFGDTYWSKVWGGDGYRPLTMLGFSLQWSLGHGSPLIFHAVNLVLYAALCLAVYWLASGVLPYAPAWIAAAAFAVHPVHVEAVANIVGQSELAVGLLLTVAMSLYVHGRSVGPISIGRRVAIGACYAVALFFKEHAIVLPALIVVAEATVVRDPQSLWRRLMAQRAFLLGLTALAVSYLWARDAALAGNLAGFQPFIVFQGLHLSRPDRILTMVGAATQWVRLFLWPVHLTTEYAPPYVDIAQGPSFTQLPGLLLMIGVIGLAFATRRRAPAASFGLGWTIVAMAPVSNLLVPAGFIIAERTLLMPSVGVLIALGASIPVAYEWLAARRLQLAGTAAVSLALVAGGWRSATRQPVWHDDDALFKQATKDTPDSYRAHYMLGAWYMQNKRLKDGEAEYRAAMKLFPFDPFMAYSLAENYRGYGMCDPAVNLYRWELVVEPDAHMGRKELAWCLLIQGHFDSAKAVAVDAIQRGGRLPPLRDIIHAADSAKRNVRAGKAPGLGSGDLPPSLQNTRSNTSRPKAPPDATLGFPRS
jgi:protein O-mannosyl-transferase